jgi:hypothetical protein
MIPQERGLEGISLVIIIYLPIIDFMEKRGLHELLNYLKIPWRLFLGHYSLGSSYSHWFTCSSSSSLTTASSCALGLSMETYGRKRRAIVEWM